MEASKWTHFWDMHSGGGSKEEWSHIFVELPQKKAIVWFYNRFGHSPERVSCTCCGEDYSISDEETLEEATAYQRNCAWSNEERGYIEKPSEFGHYKTLEEYKQEDNVLIVGIDQVKPEELEGEVPQEGYVWQ